MAKCVYYLRNGRRRNRRYLDLDLDLDLDKIFFLVYIYISSDRCWKHPELIRYYKLYFYFL